MKTKLSIGILLFILVGISGGIIYLNNMDFNEYKSQIAEVSAKFNPSKSHYHT